MTRRTRRVGPGGGRRAGGAARPEQLDEMTLPGHEPAGRPAAGLRRPGRRAGPGRRRPHGRPGAARALAARLLRARRATRPSRSSTAWRTSATAGRSRCAARWRIQHGKPIFFMSASFQRAEEGLDHHDAGPAGRARARRRCRRWPSGSRRYPERLGIWTQHARARSTCATSASPAGCRPATARADAAPAGLDAHRRQAARRPAAARLRAHLRLRPDPARLGAVRARRGVGAGRRDRRQPGPRAVVPPAVPGRRVVPLRLLEPVGVRRRGLATGRMFTADGRHIATAVQEGLLRRVGA